MIIRQRGKSLARRLGTGTGFGDDPRVLLLLVFIAACGDEPSSRDAGSDAADAAVMPWSPIAPEAPALPELGPCPPGFASEREPIAGLEVCAPFMGEARSECATQEAQLASSAACSRIGEACTADGFPAVDAAIFVRALASAGGTGTRAAPLSTIGAALSRARSGDVIAIGEGTYDEALRVPGGVTLVGACLERTTLTSSASGLTGVIEVIGDGVVLRSIHVGPSARFAISSSGFDFTVEGAVLEGASGIGLYVDRMATVDARNLVVRGTRAAGDSPGIGVFVERATLGIERAVLASNAAWGAYAATYSHVTIEDVVVEGNGGGRADTGLLVHGGGELTVRAALVENNAGGGAIALQPGSNLRVEHAIFRDHPRRAIEVQAGAAIEVSSTIIERTAEAGVLATDAETRATLRHVIVVDAAGSAGTQANGVAVQEGAHADVERMLLARTSSSALIVSSESTARLSDLVVLDATSGLGASGALHVQLGGSAELERARFAGNSGAAMHCSHGATLLASDVLIEDTRSLVSSGMFGRGLNVSRGGTMRVERAIVRDSHEVAANADDPMTVLELTDVALLDTHARECAEDECPDVPAGFGLGVFREAEVHARNLLIERAHLCGIILEADVDIEASEVREHPIGACVQTPGIDVVGLSQRVRFADNVVNVDATQLPIPDPFAPIVE